MRYHVIRKGDPYNNAGYYGRLSNYTLQEYDEYLRAETACFKLMNCYGDEWVIVDTLTNQLIVP